MTGASPAATATVDVQDGLPTPRRYWAVAAITIGLATSVVSTAIANIALPTIARDLNISAAASVWIVNAYQIAVMVSLLPIAALGDVIGYRTVYRGGLVVFALASLVCALTGDLATLCIARAGQGVGAAGIMSIQPALVRLIYPRANLGRGLGFNGMVVAFCLAMGPSMGAAIMSVASWPWLFAATTPLSLLALALSWRTLPRSNPALRTFDIPSAILSGATFGLLILGIDGFAHHHPGWMIALEFAATAVLGTLFVRRQKRLPAPLLPLDLFKRPVFALSIVSSTCTFTAQGLAFVSLPFFFQSVLGRSQVDTGLLLTAWPLAIAVTAPVSGRLSDRIPAGVLGGIGLASLGTGMLLLAFLPANPGDWTIVWRLAMCGFGFSMFSAPNNRLVMNSVPRERSGSAGGIIATARVLGQTIGAALVALVFTLFAFETGGAAAARAASAALFVGACFAITAWMTSSLRLVWRGNAMKA